MKKSVLAVSFVAFFWGYAMSASAAVVFSEIAWMGSIHSSSDEWIELHNEGTTTADLTGWKITGKGNATIILLSGNVSPDGYFLIERSDDNAVPYVPADLVVSFGKGISNDGETLKLLDGVGTVVDTVVGGKNWSKLGGNKVSKQTPQRTPSGWITAPPTPRAPNMTPSIASDVAAPVTKVKSVQQVKVAHVAELSQGNVWPVQTKLPTKNAITAPAPTLKPQFNSTSSVTANVLFQRGQNSDAEKRAWTWMIVAVLLVIAASVIIMRANIYEPTEADKYAIIEDIIEGKEDAERLSDY